MLSKVGSVYCYGLGLHINDNPVLVLVLGPNNCWSVRLWCLSNHDLNTNTWSGSNPNRLLSDAAFVRMWKSCDNATGFFFFFCTYQIVVVVVCSVLVSCIFWKSSSLFTPPTSVCCVFPIPCKLWQLSIHFYLRYSLPTWLLLKYSKNGRVSISLWRPCGHSSCIVHCVYHHSAA